MHEDPLFPVALVVSGRPCLVVGGGPVAARKVAALLLCGADVTVIAPEVTPEIHSMASGSSQGARSEGGLTIEQRPYRAGEARHFRLVVAATGAPEVDHAIFDDAEAAGVWVNSADDVNNCSFLLPAVHRDGPVTVAVSTAGASPALAGWLRNRIADGLGPDITTLAGLLDEARRRLHFAERSTESIDWVTLIDQVIAPLVQAGKVDEARAVLAGVTTA